MNLKTQKGSALIQVVLAVVILTILGTALLSLTTTEIWQVEKDNKQQQAYYYARSGIEIGRSLFETDFATSFESIPFYIYGDLDKGMTIVYNKYNTGNSTVDGSQIFVVVSKTTQDDVSTVKINSTGRVSEYNRELLYAFTYSQHTGEEPDGLMIPPVEADNTGPEEQGGLGWYQEDGTINNGDFSSDYPVVFQNDGDTVTKTNSNPGVLTAPAMYFMDTPESLVIESSHTLNLETDFLGFAGDVNGTLHQNVIQIGRLKIDVINSNLYGQDISGGEPDKRYGVLYIGSRIKNADQSTTNVLLGENPDERGYYYFPDGINLTSQTEISRLIKTEFENIKFENLGIDIGNGGGEISPGVFR